jgi:uncharacterized protein (TIGR00251 family)
MAAKMPETRLSVRVTPRASKNSVMRYKDGVLYIRLAAPPVEGAANNACCVFVAKLLRLRASQVAVCSGLKSRDKVLVIARLSEEIIRSRLQEASADS